METPVEAETVDDVGTDATSDAVGRFEKEEWDVGGVEVSGGGEAGETAADYDGSFRVVEGGFWDECDTAVVVVMMVATVVVVVEEEVRVCGGGECGRDDHWICWI